MMAPRIAVMFAVPLSRSSSRRFVILKSDVMPVR